VHPPDPLQKWLTHQKKALIRLYTLDGRSSGINRFYMLQFYNFTFLLFLLQVVASFKIRLYNCNSSCTKHRDAYVDRFNFVVAIILATLSCFGKTAKLNPFGLPGLPRHHCPDYRGIIARITEASLPGLPRHHCPDYRGIIARITEASAAAEKTEEESILKITTAQ
jgi:hypothetical protein